ncbi:DUF6427 family protein [Polaribacter sp. Hel_I_88]|uniref:DUF6427 family protein n=1 Tax=Polaribacter sp. Hel_I_88 TaxID=1250006 RepID=UPI00055D353A|nr:DUF6427 family protein [Polaribacter sp. Hel_I_88]
MLANFLNKSKPINFIGLLILFFIGFLFSVFSTFFAETFNGDLFIKSVVLLLLFMLVFFVYNFIISKNKLTHDNSYAYFFFTLLTLCFLQELLEYRVLILATIYLLFIRKLYSLRSSKKVLEKLFDSGFWLGILCILEPLTIILFLLIYIASYLHKKITIHTLLVPIIGFITPIFLYFTYFFWFDRTEEFTNNFNFNIYFDAQFYTESKFYWVFSCLLIFTIISIFFKSIGALSVNNTFRKNWILIITNFSLLLTFLLCIPEKTGAEVIYILFPISIILANGVELISKKILKNIVLYFFLICAISVCVLL